MVLNAALLDVFITNGVLLFVGIYLVPSLMMIFLAIMPVLTVAILLTYALLRSILGRGLHPISVHSNGIQFPEFLFNRMIRRPSFVGKEDIVSIWVSPYLSTAIDEKTGRSLTLSLRTRSGRTYDTGIRSGSEMEPTIEWIERNWGIPVERRSSQLVRPTGRAGASAGEMRVVERHCPRCGRKCDVTMLFCPQCGTDLDSSRSTGVAKEAGGMLTSEPSYDGYMRSPQAPPSYDATPYAPQYLPNGGGRHEDLRGKDPRLAFMLGLIPGFLGFMGVGHIYMGRVAKGLVILVVGGILAIFSLVAITTVLEPSEFDLEVRLITAAIFSIPFLLLHIWQVFDAPKSR